MTLSELYKTLDMEGPSDLEYFEQFADLMEMALIPACTQTAK